MKDRHKQWAKLGHRYTPPVAPKPPAPVTMRNVAGIRELEDKILLYSDRRGELEGHYRDKVDLACREIFGVSSADTEFEWPPGFSDMKEADTEYWEVMYDYQQHEDAFETPNLDAEERAARLRELGLDFTDAAGEPLRCLTYFARAAEAAAKGMKGYKTKLPTQEQVSVATFEDQLQADAAAFLRSKRSR